MSDIRPTDEQIRAGWEALEDSRSLTANREHHEFLDAIEALYPLPKRWGPGGWGYLGQPREVLVEPAGADSILNESTP